MGACCSAPAGAGDRVARADPELREVTLQADTVSRVGMASASLAYSLLTTSNDSVVFLDVRGKPAYDKSHIFGAWCIDLPALKASAASDGKDGPHVAFRARCSLRSVVICGSGSQPAALREEAVLDALRVLEQVNARPKGGQALVLRGGIPAFTKRFAFCMRQSGGETSQPLPPCPAEMVLPEPGKAQALLYVGIERCLTEVGTAKVLASLGIKTILSMGSQKLQPPKGVRLVKVPTGKDSKDDAVSIALAAQEKLAQQTTPCLMCGPLAALASALFAAEAMPSTLPSTETVEAYVKLRLPWAEFDTCAQSAVAQAVAKGRGDRDLPPLLDPADIVAVVDGESSPTAADPADTIVQDTCNKFLKRDRKKAEVALETVRRALTHVVEHPTEPKYRRLKGGNERVKREVFAHEEAVKLLRCCGWIADGEDLILPPPTPLERMRDVLAQMPGGAKSSASK